MGANNHPTVKPNDVDIGVKRTRLVADLRALSVVPHAEPSDFAKNGVTFTSESGDIRPDVLTVLAEHDAFLPAEQPDSRYEHSALIELCRTDGFGRDSSIAERCDELEGK